MWFIGWLHLFIYMRAYLTHYYLESSEQVAYIKT